MRVSSTTLVFQRGGNTRTSPRSWTRSADSNQTKLKQVSSKIFPFTPVFPRESRAEEMGQSAGGVTFNTATLPLRTGTTPLSCHLPDTPTNALPAREMPGSYTQSNYFIWAPAEVPSRSLCSDTLVLSFLRASEGVYASVPASSLSIPVRWLAHFHERGTHHPCLPEATITVMIPSLPPYSSDS